MIVKTFWILKNGIKNQISIVCLLVAFALLGCAKYVDVPPPSTSLTSENVYTDNTTAASVLTGIYTNISTNSPQLGQSVDAISLASGLSADELTLFGGAANINMLLVQFYQNNLNAGQSTVSAGSLWSSFYSNIYITNVALERLTLSNSLSPKVKQQLIGEAKFLRAYFYFYLVNLYGNVPLIVSSDYSVNAVIHQAKIFQVYKQIIADLEDAQSLLSDGYVASDAISSTLERVRPNKWAATALLAKTYLFTQFWDSAKVESTLIINNSAEYRLDSLDNVFLSNSMEAIWQLQPVNTGWNTEDGRVFVLPSTGPTSNSSINGYPVYLSTQLLDAFEPGDKRRSNWVDSVVVDSANTYYYPYKYKSATLNAPVTEYTMVFRLGEQYLIRAEAEAEQNDLTNAVKDLNTIRNRASLPAVPLNTQSELLSEIMHERQVELFAEWGNRWLDLKRTGTVDQVMTQVAPMKATTWNSNSQLYPLPLYDITEDPNLVQNPGY